MKIPFTTEKLPKHTERYVVWNEKGGELVYLVGYCDDSVDRFLGFFLDAKKAVPEISSKDTICTKVKQSSTKKGFTLCLIKVKGEEREIPGFEKVEWRSLDIQAY
jgi:hypothetical protein